MDDLIERLRSVKWEVTDEGDRMSDDPTHKCVFVDMRPDDFRALLDEAAAALEAAREDAERYRWLREKGHPDSNSGIAVSVDSWNDWGRPQATYLSGAELDAAIDAAREARNG